MKALTRKERRKERGVTRWDPWWGRWDPFRDLEEMTNRLSSLFGRPLSQRFDGGRRESLTLSEWTPLVDISEDDKEYLVTAEIPDVRKDDVKVAVENGVLMIRGERKHEEEQKGKRYHRVEREYGAFERSFTLPEDADAEKVNAEFHDGLLKVHIAKSESAKPKYIDIKVS
jgi:HSP20 family protein